MDFAAIFLEIIKSRQHRSQIVKCKSHFEYMFFFAHVETPHTIGSVSQFHAEEAAFVGSTSLATQKEKKP